MSEQSVSRRQFFTLMGWGGGLVLASLVAGNEFVGMVPVVAEAAAATMKVLKSTPMPDSDGERHRFRVSTNISTGGIAYCGQGYAISPEAGAVLNRYGSLDIPELDYVMYHGYDGVEVTSLDGLSAVESEHATALAVWLAIADQRYDVLKYNNSVIGDPESWMHGNRYYQERYDITQSEAVKRAAKKLYDAAMAYKRAGGGGTEAGCAIYWKNTNVVTLEGIGRGYWGQGLVTAAKVHTGNARLTKKAKHTDWL